MPPMAPRSLNRYSVSPGTQDIPDLTDPLQTRAAPVAPRTALPTYAGRPQNPSQWTPELQASADAVTNYRQQFGHAWLKSNGAKLDANGRAVGGDTSDFDTALAQDPQYQKLQQQHLAAQQAHEQGLTGQQYQSNQASADAATNTAAAIGSDARNRTTLAGADANESYSRAGVNQATSSTLIPAQANQANANANAANTSARVAGEQWDQTRPLYPRMVTADITGKEAQANQANAAADAARVNATSGAVAAYGAANRPQVMKNDDGSTTAVPPTTTYSAPEPGSLLPKMTPAQTPAAPQAPASAMQQPAAAGPESPAPAPAAPGLLRRAWNGVTNAVTQNVPLIGAGAMKTAANLSNPAAAIYNAGSDFVRGFNGTAAAPAAPSTQPTANQYVDGQTAVIAGQKYIRQGGRWILQAPATQPTTQTAAR